MGLSQVLKFLAQLVPKMALSTKVLRECVNDLVFFMIAFAISMGAFSMMLCVQVTAVHRTHRVARSLGCSSLLPGRAAERSVVSC